MTVHGWVCTWVWIWMSVYVICIYDQGGFPWRGAAKGTRTYQQRHLEGRPDDLLERKLAQGRDVGFAEPRGQLAQDAQLHAPFLQEVGDAGRRHHDDEQREAAHVVRQLEELVLHALGRGRVVALDHLDRHEDG